MAASDLKNVMVRAKIDLIKTEDGGRAHPVHSKHRPNHILADELDGYTRIGVIIIEDDEVILPGTSREVVIEFLIEDKIKAKLRPGFRWNINEGSRLIGTGTVLELL
jgi:translation elongation factor EF-Tu-like GTPase